MPSPAQFLTARDDGAHCGAGPPCTFRYAHPIPNITKKRGKTGFGDVWWFSTPRSSNIPPWHEGGVHYPLYYDDLLLRARYTPHTWKERLPNRSTETGYAVRNAVCTRIGSLPAASA